jgi:hypothetical protein
MTLSINSHAGQIGQMAYRDSYNNICKTGPFSSKAL